MSTVPPIQLPEGLGITRRELIAALGGLSAGALSAFGVAQATLGTHTEYAMPEIQVDPFWTREVYDDSSVTLRPVTSPAQTRGSILPSLVPSVYASNQPAQITMFYFDEDDQDTPFKLPTQVEPAFEKGDYSLVMHLLGAHASTELRKNTDDHATIKFELSDGIENDRNYGFLMSGLNVFKNPALGWGINQQVLGGRPPVIIRNGDLRLTFNLWRHKPKTWWSSLLGFVKNGADIWTKATTALAPLVVVPQASTPALKLINNLIGLVEGVDKKSNDAYQYIWQDGEKKLAITKEAKQTIGWPYSLRPGHWIVTDLRGQEYLYNAQGLTLQRDTGFFIARKTQPTTPALDDINYIVMKITMNPAPETDKGGGKSVVGSVSK